MRYPQVVVLEHDSRLAEGVTSRWQQPLAGRLPDLWERRRWAVRETKQPAECLRLLAEGGPSVLVLKLRRDLLTELDAFERVCRLLPWVPVVVVGDTADPRLAAWCWDVGARYVLMGPAEQDNLAEIVEALMDAQAGAAP